MDKIFSKQPQLYYRLTDGLFSIFSLDSRRIGYTVHREITSKFLKSSIIIDSGSALCAVSYPRGRPAADYNWNSHRYLSGPMAPAYDVRGETGLQLALVF